MVFFNCSGIIVGAMVGYFSHSLSTKGEATKLMYNKSVDTKNVEDLYSGLLLNKTIKCGCWDGSHSFDCCPELAKEIFKKYEEQNQQKLISYDDCLEYDGVPVFDYPDGEGPPNYILCLARENSFVIVTSDE
jgi:hypothetical protein